MNNKFLKILNDKFIEKTNIIYINNVKLIKILEKKLEKKGYEWRVKGNNLYIFNYMYKNQYQKVKQENIIKIFSTERYRTFFIESENNIEAFIKILNILEKEKNVTNYK